MSDWLDKLPQPWDMVVAWLLYLGTVAIGFAITYWIVGLL